LKELAVLVEDLHPDIQQDGLEKNTIQTDVELKLRLAGIKVVPIKEVARTPGGQYLYVNVNSLRMEGLPLYAISVELELQQSVWLAREPKTNLPGATTWQISRVGGVGKAAVSSMRDTIKDLVDGFVNDYLAANPPK
jgi:hypothetical protein